MSGDNLDLRVNSLEIMWWITGVKQNHLGGEWRRRKPEDYEQTPDRILQNTIIEGGCAREGEG